MWLYSSLLMNCWIILILLAIGTFSIFSGAVGLSGMQKSTQTSWCVRRMSFCVFARQCEVVSGGSVSWLISAEIRHSGVSSSPPKERARSQARHHSSVNR